MKRISFGLLILASFVAMTASFADQKPSSNQEPKERLWLQQFVGEWTLSSELTMPGSEEAPIKSKGLMKSRMLGDVWVVLESSGEVDGKIVTAVQTIGFNSARAKYVATWVGSVTDHMWMSEGALEGNTLVLETEGPSVFEEGKRAKYRDTYEFQRDDYIVQRSTTLNDKGEWVPYMTSEYRRQK